MRFLQGKEAERLVRRGVRVLTRQEKRKLGLSLTNTYYVREDLKRPNRRSVVATSRQVRQARAQLGIVPEMAERVRGRAGRPRRVPTERADALERANRDYQQGRITLDQVREQVREWIERSGAGRETLARLLFDGAEVIWYRRQYKDGVQYVINWVNQDYQMTRDVQVERLISIIDSLQFDLIGYAVYKRIYAISSLTGTWELRGSSWVSSVTVDREQAESDVEDVRRGETGRLDSIHLFYVLFIRKPSVSVDFVELTVRISYFVG